MGKFREKMSNLPSLILWASLTVAMLVLFGLILVNGRLVQAGIPTEMIQPDSADPIASPAITNTVYLPLLFMNRFSTRGMIAFERHDSADDPHDIWLMYNDGSRQMNLTNSPGADDGAPTWSPDGKSIAFGSRPLVPANSNAVIYKMELETRQVVQLTNGAYDDNWPAWSPLGDKIAFMREANLPPDIYVMDADGTNQTRLTTWLYGDDFPAWSPDGAWIAFSSDRDYAGRDLYLMRPDGTNQQRILLTPDQDEVYPTWGPDGWIYYTFGIERKPQRKDWLYRIHPQTASRQQVFDDEYNRYIASWSPDGECFVFYSTMGGIAGSDKEIWKWCHGFTDPINLTRNDVGDEFAAWSPVP
jgi:Tol biopolymer transport system component